MKMYKNELATDNGNRISGITIQLSELLYLCFWGFMLFAKGIGLYDGQLAYKIFLIAAFLCIALKMCITEYSLREWVIILLLLALSLVVYLVSREKGALICMVTVTAMKNVSVKKAFQVGLVVWTVAMGGRFLLSLACIENVKTAVQVKNVTGAVLRYFMGYPHPNVLHISYFTLTAFTIYCWKKSYSLKHLLILGAGNLFLFFYSYSFTGACIVMLYICLSYYISRKPLNSLEYALIKLFFLFCVLFSIIAPIVLQGNAFELADKVFNNRIHLAKQFLTLKNISLFGNDMTSVTAKDTISMDNSFVFTLITYGILIFILMIVGYIGAICAYIKQKKNIELIMICCFLMAGIIEPFLFNTSFKNLTLLFIGEWFCCILQKGKKKQRQYAIIKNCDKKIIVFNELLEKPMRSLKRLQNNTHLVVGLSAIIAIFTSILVGIRYQDRADVLEVAKDNLLVYERIRVIITAFVFVFAILYVVGNVIYTHIKNKREI